MDAFWIILTGALVGITCGLLGCFLLLRKMTMIGDAISHAVLPGIVIAYLISGSIGNVPMLIGAAVVGLVVTIIIETLSKKGGLQEDAAIGVSFTALFAIGVILISAFADSVDLDQDCVLYGEIAYVPLDTWMIGDIDMGPIATWLLGGNLLIVLAFIIIGYKGLKLTSFDPLFASSIGISVTLWHYLLMGAVSMTTVFSFEAVGAIMVVAFLVGPAAIAYLLTERLSHMLIIASVAGTLASVGGYILAIAIDGSIAGAMSTFIGLEFMLAFLFSPKQGFISKKIALRLQK